MDCTTKFFGENLEDWLSINLRGEIRMSDGSIEGPIMFAVLCWLLWRNRNKFVFQQELCEPKAVVRSTATFDFNICETNHNRMLWVTM